MELEKYNTVIKLPTPNPDAGVLNTDPKVVNPDLVLKLAVVNPEPG